MSAGTNGTKRIWLIAAAGAAAGTAMFIVFMTLAKVPVPRPTTLAPPSPPRPAIALAKRGETLDDVATLLDPTPLFLPTRWNAAQQDVAPPEPGGTFQSYRVPPKWSFAETELMFDRRAPTGTPNQPADAPQAPATLDLPAPIAVPATPAKALAETLPGALALGFGETGTPVVPLLARGAVVEITAASTGEPAFPPQIQAQVAALTGQAHPPASRAWRPMEFQAEIDATGLAAPPVVTTPSGIEEVDLYFQEFLVRTLRLGERLAPGFYRISVGP